MYEERDCDSEEVELDIGKQAVLYTLGLMSDQASAADDEVRQLKLDIDSGCALTEKQAGALAAAHQRAANLFTAIEQIHLLLRLKDPSARSTASPGYRW